MPDRSRVRRTAALGLSLIEVLVSIVIISVGLLGLIGMQARSMSGQKDSFDRKAAAELLGQLTERMRANHLAFMDNAYASSLLPGATLSSASACLPASPCSPAQVAALDLMNWRQDLRARLPDSGAVVAPTGPMGAAMGAGATSMRITVVWRESSPNIGADAQCAAIGIADASYRCLAAEVFP